MPTFARVCINLSLVLFIFVFASHHWLFFSWQWTAIWDSQPLWLRGEVRKEYVVLILDCPKNKIHLLHSNLMVVSQQVQGQNMSLSLLSWKLGRLDYSLLTGWLQNHAKLYYRIRRIYSCLLQIVQVVSNHMVTLLFYSIIECFDTVTQTCLSQNSRSGTVDLHVVSQILRALNHLCQVILVQLLESHSILFLHSMSFQGVQGKSYLPATSHQGRLKHTISNYCPPPTVIQPTSTSNTH